MCRERSNASAYLPVRDNTPKGVVVLIPSQKVAMNHLRPFVVVAACLLLAACADVPPSAPIEPQPTFQPDIPVVEANEENALSAFVRFTAPTADSARAVVSRPSSKDVTYTFSRTSQEGRFVLLGLQPSTTYNIVVEAWKGNEHQVSPQHTFITAPLPLPLKDAYLELLSGDRPKHGYIMVPMVTDQTSYLVAFDSTGRLAWYRDFGRVPLVEAKQQTNGHFTVFLGTTRGWDRVPGEFQEVSRSGTLVRTWKAPDGYYTDSHEIQVRVEDGQTVAYFFGYDFKSADGLPGYNAGDEIAGHQLFRVTADGAWKIMHNAWDNFSLDEMLEPPLPSGDFDHPNSVGFDTDGNFIISYRVLGTVVKVDGETGKVIWHLGGRKNDFTFINDPEGGFSAQHDAQILANGDLLVFDNGWRHDPQYSRALEYRLDEKAKTATLVWSYIRDPKTFTAYTGSVQRTMDGNTFIGFSSLNEIAEVSSSGKLLGQYRPMISNAQSSGFYRAVVVRNLFRYQLP
jgi:hypothetical protein